MRAVGGNKERYPALHPHLEGRQLLQGLTQIQAYGRTWTSKSCRILSQVRRIVSAGKFHSYQPLGKKTSAALPPSPPRGPGMRF